MPDKTLLIHTEQGAGDAIQFARYLPFAAQRCGRLIVVCPRALQPLFATLPGIGQLREAGQIQVHEFDTYLPLLSLARVFGTTPATIPAEVPYIEVAALRRRKSVEVLPRLSPAQPLKVGLVWAGSPTHVQDRHRSCALQTFAPVLRVPGVAFYSLQKGERSHELASLSPAGTVQDLAPYLDDFGDLALILNQLDLLISVDTAAAHLAGALGKPVWTLLPAVADWRWGVAGETTPWYPTMRLYRQGRLGDWTPVLECIAQHLTAWRDREREAKKEVAVAG
jgi:hypothetical protein